jgi:hypothetical protein
MTGGKVGMLEERLVIETYRRLTPPEQQKIYYSLETFILNHTPARRMTAKFQLTRIFIGNAGFVRYCLEQGIRSPQLMLERVWRAFWGEVWAVAKATPGLWRDRKTEPERPMLALVKLTYRGADLWGAMEFFAADWGKVARRRRSEGGEARPLRGVLFTAASKPTSEMTDLSEALADRLELQIVSIAGKSDDHIRNAASAMNLRALDLVLTDSPKAARALAVLRGPRPHLQLVLWISDPKPLNYLKTLKHLWDKRAGAVGRLARDRSLVREVDQVVVSAAWLTRPLARFLLPMPRAVIAAPLPAKGGAREQVLATWRGVIDEARLWAPRRLSP